MTSKVFLFDGFRFIYCSDLSYDGQDRYKGYVINGNYRIVIDVASDTITHSYGTQKAKLVWACDPVKGGDYNTVIVDAQERYAAGETADFVLKLNPYVGYKLKDDEVAF
jgi:hypothetical protein